MPSTIGWELVKVCHLPVLMYGAAMACALWKNGCASFDALPPISAPTPNPLPAFPPYPSASGHCDVNMRIWKVALSVLSGQATDVIRMQVRDQNDVDFFRRVACAAEAALQAPECSPTPPRAGTRIDED